MHPLLAATLAVRFALEVVAVVLVGLWAATGADGVGGVLLGLGAATAYAAAWGVLASPKALVPLAPPVKVAVQLLLLGLGAVALVALDRPGTAVLYLVVVLSNAALLLLLERPRAGAG